MVDKAPDFAVEPAPTPKPAGTGKPGRPKGTTNAARSATAVNADVRQAMASLDMMYELISTGLLMYGRPQTAAVWMGKSASLRETNENALKSAPKLAKFLAGVGSTSGAVTFLAAHAVAFSAVAFSFMAESAEPTEKEKTPNDGASAPYMG